MPAQSQQRHGGLPARLATEEGVMDLYPFKFTPRGPALFMVAVGVFGLALNLAFDMLLVFLLAYAAAKGWAAAT